jgi:hypothetical protein
MRTGAMPQSPLVAIRPDELQAVQLVVVAHRNDQRPFKNAQAVLLDA